ncbi:Uncharacterised protein [Listeria fleischmannii subsp. fleischmannii]|uniref:Uncharacterized protein n=1 Tax=Listeria fleischmannii subsp. fleischmannii TaxID=1671902 RepID=A0A2X3GKN3_9LIST|nr:hypothetical protein LFLEISCH_03570 [Listeria fleischmannii subsp. fleischmannii LU2006-1]SQC68802.1 Uncharacterised protein [Listeria fleischmannii subsp. fleischmannii]
MRTVNNGPKITQERKTVTAMIELYCKKITIHRAYVTRAKIYKTMQCNVWIFADLAKKRARVKNVVSIVTAPIIVIKLSV